MGAPLTCLNMTTMQAFDELLLLKRGGRVIYNGPTGKESCDLVAYFEHIQGVPKIEEGINPATWMLEVRLAGSALSGGRQCDRMPAGCMREPRQLF